MRRRNREGWVGGQGGGGGGACYNGDNPCTVSPSRPSAKPDQLLKELLTDCCWRAARERPSVAVSLSISPARPVEIERRREEGRRGGGRRREGEPGKHRQRAAVSEAAVDGSLGFRRV